MTVPRWSGNTATVPVVFVCSPLQVLRAKERYPKSKLIGVAHQGFGHKLPPSDDLFAVVAFSDAVRDFVLDDTNHVARLSKLKSVYTIIPAFSIERVWSWRPGCIWSMMSRPHSREGIARSTMETIRDLCPVPIEVFGQGQSRGYLVDAHRRERLARSSCYFAALHPRAGISLAAHEAMASGCPVVGTYWGDYAWWHEKSGKPSRGMYEFGDIYNLSDCLELVARSRQSAVQISEAQCQYIAERFSQSAMDDSIERLLTEVLA